jgi:hypothetical protein
MLVAQDREDFANHRPAGLDCGPQLLGSHVKLSGPVSDLVRLRARFVIALFRCLKGICLHEKTIAIGMPEGTNGLPAGHANCCTEVWICRRKQAFMSCKPILVCMLAAASLAGCASPRPEISASAGGSSSLGAPSFDRLDANHDGFVSLEEGAADARVSRSFVSADKNADWRLSREEFDSAFAR